MGETAVRMMRHACPGIIAATAERGNKTTPTLRGRLRYPSRRLLAVDERMRLRRYHRERHENHGGGTLGRTDDETGRRGRDALTTREPETTNETGRRNSPRTGTMR